MGSKFKVKLNKSKKNNNKRKMVLTELLIIELNIYFLF